MRSGRLLTLMGVDGLITNFSGVLLSLLDKSSSKMLESKKVPSLGISLLDVSEIDEGDGAQPSNKPIGTSAETNNAVFYQSSFFLLLFIFRFTVKANKSWLISFSGLFAKPTK
jgi:hypothetical protein